MPGRRPKPTALKELQGNPGHRALNHNEPKPTGIPTCPKHLDKTAKAEWRRISEALISLGLLTSVDRAALAAYCAAYSTWVEAETSMQKFGRVITSPSGYSIQSPYVGIRNTSLDLMRKFLVEFGMTPASRSRLQLSSDTPPAKDAFEAFMQSIGADSLNDVQPEGT